MNTPKPVEPHPLRLESFDAFYRAHHDPVYRSLALTIRSATLAAEATDEAFTRAFERWSQVQAYENAPGWVYRVALNWARSRMRRRRFELVADPPETGAVDGFDPDLDRALARLPLEQRSMVVLKHHAGWNYTEIAEVLQMPVGTVKSRLHRAIVELRAALEVRS